MQWEERAKALADSSSYRGSRWWIPVVRTQRHLLVPRWFESGPDGWTCMDGPADEEVWARTAYSNKTLVTRVGPLHADHVKPGDVVTGHPTSSATLPGLVVTMIRHGRLQVGLRVLDIATGSGYSAALACRALGDERVTTQDVDPYLCDVAAQRLKTLGFRPEVVTADATTELHGTYDRIVSMVGMPRIPPVWLDHLERDGRLVTTIAKTGLIITATKTADGGAVGHVEWDRASFMATRTGDDYAPPLDDLFDIAVESDGDEVTTSPFPILNVAQAWEVWSMLTLTAPGIDHRFGVDADGMPAMWMLHADGSWARASTRPGERTSTVHQGGPRRLYDILEGIRWRWLERGELPVYGAKVTVSPDGETTLTRDGWTATL